MKRARNHIHVLVSQDGVAKGTEEVEERVKAEVKIVTPEPLEAKKKLEQNITETIAVKTSETIKDG